MKNEKQNKNQKTKNQQKKSKKWKIKKRKKRRGLQEWYHPRRLNFFVRNVTRNRAAIEAQNEKIKKERKKLTLNPRSRSAHQASYLFVFKTMTILKMFEKFQKLKKPREEGRAFFYFFICFEFCVFQCFQNWKQRAPSPTVATTFRAHLNDPVGRRSLNWNCDSNPESGGHLDLNCGSNPNSPYLSVTVTLFIFLIL